MSLTCCEDQREGERAERWRPRAVGHGLRVVHRLQRPRPERSRRIVARGGLDADHLAGWSERTGGERGAREQSAAAARDEEKVELADVLEQLTRGRALAGDDVGVIVGRDEREAAIASQSPADGLAVFLVAIVDDHLGRRSPRWPSVSPPARPTA